MASRVIHVCGDPTVDWLSIRADEGALSSPYFWQADHSHTHLRLSSQAGGSAMLSRLLEALVQNGEISIVGPSLAPALLREPKTGTVATSWTAWRPYPAAVPGGRPAYRIVEWRECEPGAWDYPNNRLRDCPHVLVIEDSGMGFRHAAAGWPEALDTGAGRPRPQQIILKLSQLAGPANPLLRRILDLGLGPRTTILTTINDLRACAVKVGISLSWERALEEIVGAVLSPHVPFVEQDGGPLRFARVIVSVGASGVAVVGDGPDTLVFDRTGQEGDFARRLGGEMLGYNSCSAAVLARAACEDAVDWAAAAYDGLALARALHSLGYLPVTDSDGASLRFPSAELAAVLGARGTAGGAALPASVWGIGTFRDRRGLARDPGSVGRWSILAETVCRDGGQGPCRVSRAAGAIFAVARDVVQCGPEAALPNVPLEMVGGWRSADRQEIEGVRSVHNAIRGYLQGKGAGKPLCVAVLGPPGAGKSFAVKQIARDLGLDKNAQLTFNLSQFESPRELAGAFHQVRDLHLQGKIPLVFWDEFDTPLDGNELGWLRYFLAPMQDGVFFEDGREHPVGGGIYVFAGATRASFAAFRQGASPQEAAAKKPDFISRLRAYIDVRGPNGNPNTVEDAVYVVRRAFLLNQYLINYAPQLRRGKTFDLEEDVLNAFLGVGHYHHGARSMETIVAMSNLGSKRKYELSSLPPDQILGMHVNAPHFRALLRRGRRESLRIGVSGHINLDPDRLGLVEAGVARAVDFVLQQFPGRQITVFSPLAAGADRLVARAILAAEEAGLIAVLPLPPEDYLADFGRSDDPHEDYQGAELRREFRHWLSYRAMEAIQLPPSPTREEAYRQAGYFVAEHADVLVAVWDGEPAQGTGGTGQVVARALALGLPVCHVWAGNHKQVRGKATEVGEKHGQVRHVNFPGYSPGQWCAAKG